MSAIQQNVQKLMRCEYQNPYELLGMHHLQKNKQNCTVIRAFEPGAKALYVIDLLDPENMQKMTSRYAPYFFEFTTPKAMSRYQLKAVYENKTERIFYDPYAFPGLLTDYDLYLFSEGNHHTIYNKMGAHEATINDVAGVYYAVWAPNATTVSVIGDFNCWDGRRHQMRSMSDSGIWEIFLPGQKTGVIYKYELKTKSGQVLEKSDPYGFAAEVRPCTGSVVFNIENYEWQDTAWLQKRKATNPLAQPVSIYEVHLGSWMRCPEEDNRFLTYRELAPKLAEYVKELGFTHIELMPLAEHPLDISWGYQVIQYFAPTSRFGSPEDFMYFVDYMHQNDIGVLMDWVPAHFPKDGHGLGQFDGTHLYEHQDPRKREHRDWGTYIFNYGRNEVRNFLISNALFWLDKYHLDGLRVDAVASMLYLDYSRDAGDWIPNHLGGRENFEAIYFLRRTNELVFSYYPGVMMMAEESTAWTGVSRPTNLGGLGFNFKWNMGWMNDTLVYMSKDPVHRKYHQTLLTFALLYAFHENFMLSLSHDEVVHGKRSLLDKMPGDVWQKFANLRLLYAMMYGYPGKKLLFQGSEFGQWNEWDCDRSLDWHLLEHESHQKLKRYFSDLNQLYKTEPALYEVDYNWKGFEWIDFSDYDNCVLAWLRWSQDYKECLIFVVNLTPVTREHYRIGVPYHCEYSEVLNSDSSEYWGSNQGNCGGFWSDQMPWQDRPCSVNLTLPPLGAIILKPNHK